MNENTLYLKIIILTVITFFFTNFLIKFLNIIKYKNFFDTNYKKPQSFHNSPVFKGGGIILFFFFLISYLFFNYNNILNLFLISMLPVFIASILDDINFFVKPGVRLIILFFIVLLLVFFLDLKIYSFQFYNLDILINKYKIVSILLVTFSVLFIMNGCNFIDGFNGLLAFHSIIITIFLAYINYSFKNVLLFEFCIIFLNFLVIFLFYNFPKAKIFLGNSGSYLIGFILSYIVLKTSEQTAYHKVFPFYFAILLHYLFIEVFFSFCRKVFYEKKNPLYPDKNHLHMLLYNQIKSNPKTSIYINLYFILTLSLLFLIKDFAGLLKGYFIFLILLYCIIYISLKKRKTKI